ncbi:alpha/beta hydrolase [Paractinoplanes rishiriensis]|uniref:alpha/beta hydrolase n=1 Tax=Paractinoplanes rishiriensis TaxID=1050105 RepID=UPI001EF16C46|nr:alpha/beta hydrolase-fold protein [Actinoplanes rishiriensis]
MAGAWCDGAAAWFRLPDQDQKLSGVRLLCAFLGFPEFRYAAGERRWELRVPRPDAARIEYKLELTHRDGRRETICDQGNPRRAPGGFGESSVLWCPDYREPDWLHLPPAGGDWRDLKLASAALRTELAVRVWSPATTTGHVLVVHDGPDYDKYAELGRYAAASVAAGRVPPFHLVLLPAGERFEWYSAAPAYNRALTSEILPRLAAELGTGEPVVAAGASLGGLATLAAQRHAPDRFAGLFLQSGSFFQPRFDSQESGFARYQRIIRFVAQVHRASHGPAVPVAMTCGTVEENLANNRSMAGALRGQGYEITFAENRDAHNWIGWRDALDPHLTNLLQRVWS